MTSHDMGENAMMEAMFGAEEAPDPRLDWLREIYLSPVRMGETGFACIYPLMFTHAIICGSLNDQTGFTHRWCYHSRSDAQFALDAWQKSGFEGEPEGWHRDPNTGRRRYYAEDGTYTEEIAP